MESKLTAEIIENYLKDFEIKNNLSQGLKRRKLEVIRQIVEYLNYQYKESIILYDEYKDSFTIHGSEEEQKEILQRLKEITNIDG